MSSLRQGFTQEAFNIIIPLCRRQSKKYKVDFFSAVGCSHNLSTLDGYVAATNLNKIMFVVVLIKVSL